MIYFPEYTIHDSMGNEITPYRKHGYWCAQGIRYTFAAFAKKFKIDVDEQIILKLTYGG